MNWEKIEPWDYIVISVSAEYHKKYNMVELEDIKQSLYEWFVSHPRKLTEWEAVGEKDAKNLLYRSLRNQALDYCQLWKAKSIGYETSDLFYYEPTMVEALLPSILRGDITSAPILNLGMPGRPPAPAEGGNLMAMMVEIKAAYDKLGVEDKSILFLKYAESLDYASIANSLDLSSDDAARMRHNRAVKKLIIRLGGFRPFYESPESVGDADENEESGVSADDSHSDNDSESE